MAKIRSGTQRHVVCIQAAQKHLQMAFEQAKRADSPRLAAAIRKAIKSADGARRHAERRAMNSGVEGHTSTEDNHPLDAWAEIAEAEGWGTFECGDGWEIQRDDEAAREAAGTGRARFLTDEDALNFVVERAAAGSVPHIEALDFVRRNAREGRANG